MTNERVGEALKTEFDALPERNLGRQISDVVGGRIVSIGRSRDPKGIYKQVEDMFVRINYCALDCEMMNFERLQLQRQQEFEETTRALREAHANEKEQLQYKLREMEMEMRQASHLNDGRLAEILKGAAQISAGNCQFLHGLGAGAGQFMQGLAALSLASGAMASGACSLM
ncbi:unnamed protein product [Prorocentrum cordatum]|uniref:Uncharacterized protein n=1 Tax=Prorocentrum cordatum TaxID=2364126 RepID=A0ABN9PLH5_9DINO|nr:unnamed protein product [Polarella glacialis]